MNNNEVVIKDFYGRVIGTRVTNYEGNIVMKDFYGRVLGTYYPKQNITKDFYGRVVAQGDALAMLLNNKK